MNGYQSKNWFNIDTLFFQIIYYFVIMKQINKIFKQRKVQRTKNTNSTELEKT